MVVAEQCGKNIPPTPLNDMKAINELFLSILNFIVMGRKFDENQLWGLYNSWKLPVKKDKNDNLTTYQQKVTDVFNIIRIL